jgi:hypothetical protein
MGGGEWGGGGVGVVWVGGVWWVGWGGWGRVRVKGVAIHRSCGCLRTRGCFVTHRSSLFAHTTEIRCPC